MSNLGEYRIERAQDVLDGQAERLLRKRRHFSCRKEMFEFVGYLSDEQWEKWIESLDRNLAAEMAND